MKNLRIHTFQHIPFENLGWIGAWAQERGHTVSYTRFFENAELPDLATIDWLIILGGAMGCDDEDRFPWLVHEKAFIREAIAAGKTVLGICLGAQLLAHCLGAKVYPHTHQEIGFREIALTAAAQQEALFEGMPAQLTVFQWHGDTFDLPAGATALATSDVCEHQAFRKGNSIGLQFHLEATPEIIRNMIKYDGHELVAAPFIHPAEKILAELPLADENKATLFLFLDRLAKGV
ncbi:type 1 glutamine amidotransferase [Pontibacter liquoris]|uniref:type 1 glutamine amidotransferase n=1 Tax=Pontibacter liquoris TaxID=2905677 RepID=UPI001FA7C4AC|nr:type 1 glutamine amidotransferase [Pontibacter liquoris]